MRFQGVELIFRGVDRHVEKQVARVRVRIVKNIIGAEKSTPPESRPPWIFGKKVGPPDCQLGPPYPIFFAELYQNNLILVHFVSVLTFRAPQAKFLGFLHCF